MATNEILKPGYRRALVVSSPATPASGDPVRFGKLTGVAMLDEGDGGAGATETVVDTGPGIYDLVVDDNLGTGIAVGDLIYFHDAGTGTGAVHLNNDPSGADAFFGFAEETVSANATTLIQVSHATAAVATAIADGALSAAVLGTADGLGFIRAARFTFNPSANAGERTIAAHALLATLPDNALVLGGIIEILTTFTSATDAGTIALSIEGANDLVTATAISSGTFWDAVKSKVVVPTALEASGVATAIKLTAARAVTATVAVEALTAGKLVGWLFYVVGD
jgi:predicted RecA/RadA family phage recombinase